MAVKIGQRQLAESLTKPNTTTNFALVEFTALRDNHNVLQGITVVTNFNSFKD